MVYIFCCVVVWGVNWLCMFFDCFFLLLFVEGFRFFVCLCYLVIWLFDCGVFFFLIGGKFIDCFFGFWVFLFFFLGDIFFGFFDVFLDFFFEFDMFFFVKLVVFYLYY